MNPVTVFGERSTVFKLLTVLLPWLATYIFRAFGVSAMLTGFVPTVALLVTIFDVVSIALTEFEPKFAT